MRLKTLFILALCVAVPTFACAKGKKPKKEKTVEVVEPAAPVVDTEECLMNLSLANEFIKNKQYADAIEPWTIVYTNCPSLNRAIYNQGQKLIMWQIENAQTDEEKEVLKQKLMKLYDDRITYFGDDPKYPKAYILGIKALDYCTIYPDDPTKLPAYEWMKESVTTLGAASQIPMLDKLAELSYNLYKYDASKYADQYVEDYQLVVDYLTAISKDKTNDKAPNAKQYKDRIDNIFASSGAANCDKLDELYAGTVQDNLGNLETLNKVILLYKKMRCTQSDVYFAAAEAAHKLQPTEESAVGCANMCVKKKEYKEAIAYYEQAITLAEDNYDKADYQYAIAQMYAGSASTFAESRKYALAALRNNPGMGKCYILIGKLYASSKPYGNDAKGRILNKTVYWAAVDKFQQAKRIDDTCIDEANKLISTYSRYFPTKEERFDLPGEFGSGTFTVGGWIGETTTVR